MASPFSWMLIFLKDRGGREMYWERALRAFVERAGRWRLLSTEKPECLQLIRLVANRALISSNF